MLDLGRGWFGNTMVLRFLGGVGFAWLVFVGFLEG